MAPMTVMTNAAMGELLGLTHSGVSRMRRGLRTGSHAVLVRIHEVSDIPLDEIVRAAAKAQDGDNRDWIALMDRVFSGQEQGAST